ncbi:MAG: hypothetical protein V5A66_03545 [Candidatus Thermoplasmatota archaeon]
MEIKKEFRGVSEENSKSDFKLSVYEDEKCYREVKNINFGPVRPGEEKNKWFWLKNTGERYLHKIYVGHGVIDSDGWRSMSENYLGGSLNVGEKCMALFQLKVHSEVEIGEYSGSIPITVYGDEGTI